MEEFGYAILDLHFIRPAKSMQFANIDELAHSAIGLGDIILYSVLKANGLNNKLGELTDGEV